uniref:Aldo_ket_red domain-containing protein n=2 Tax=Macrostomum lignano TaxID=282301 RepID=A0A1I8J2B4_9PLAT
MASQRESSEPNAPGWARLYNGDKIPTLFLGTFRIRGFDVIDACLDAALGAGYRGIDTAGVYRNEAEIGSALFDGPDGLVQRHGLSREQLFITSKLAPSHQGYEAAKKACLQSIQKLRCNYLDLYLIHWPGVQGLRHSDPKQAELRRESWRALEELQSAGKLRHIGVSNYELHHLEELRRYAKTPCAVLQTECHPMLQRRDLRDYCANQGIHFQAYSSLGSTDYCQQLMQHPTVLSCAQTAGCSPAQLLLRWAADLGIGALPKSIRPAHIAENAEAVLRLSPLPDEVHSALAALDCGQHFCWNPAAIR